MTIRYKEDHPMFILRNRFSGSPAFLGILRSQLEALGNCQDKRYRFCSLIILTMDEIGRSEVPIEDFIVFVKSIFEKVSKAEDSYIKKETTPMFIGLRSVSVEEIKKKEFLVSKEDPYPLQYGVKQQISKHIESSYIDHFNSIVKEIRLANKESEGNLISLVESVGCTIQNIRSKGESLDCLATLVRSRYEQLKEKKHWNVNE